MQQCDNPSPAVPSEKARELVNDALVHFDRDCGCGRCGFCISGESAKARKAADEYEARLLAYIASLESQASSKTEDEGAIVSRGSIRFEIPANTPRTRYTVRDVLGNWWTLDPITELPHTGEET